MRFDQIFDSFEERESGREEMRRYLRGLPSDVDREIGLWLHHGRVREQATNEDILAVLEECDLSEVESLYGKRVRLAADRGRNGRGYSALRCFVREVRRAREMMEAAAMALW